MTDRELAVLRLLPGELSQNARFVMNRLTLAKARKLKAYVKLRRLPKGTVAIKVVAVTQRGATLTTTRTYRTCAVKKKPKKRKLRRR